MTRSAPEQKVIILGGGAAGFFAAIHAAERYPEARLCILEKSQKLLSKVRISGGGRCNVTHACFDPAELVKFYPRGQKELRGVFARFGPTELIEWFRNRGVELKTEPDGRMFPVTDDSSTIVSCLLREADKLKVEIKTGIAIHDIRKDQNNFILEATGGGTFEADRIIVASGGNANSSAYDWLRKLGHTIVLPAPSLFTFNMPGNPVTALMGLSVGRARVSIAGTRITTEGPLLITHWGMSGPAILKASSLGARELQTLNYNFQIAVAWLPDSQNAELSEIWKLVRTQKGAQRAHASPMFGLPKRLWEFLIKKSGIRQEERWADLTKEKFNSLSSILLHDHYTVAGKTTFKEEFVTCGGISLKEVNFSDMQSKKVPGLHFAGEVLDIDGLTGGFNFQNAWSTAWVAASGLYGA